MLINDIESHSNTSTDEEREICSLLDKEKKDIEKGSVYIKKEGRKKYYYFEGKHSEGSLKNNERICFEDRDDGITIYLSYKPNYDDEEEYEIVRTEHKRGRQAGRK